MAGESIGVTCIMRRIVHGLDMREANETDNEQAKCNGTQRL